MIYVAAEFVATALDVVYMVYFISKFLHIRMLERPITLIVPGLMLIWQLVADRFFSSIGLIYLLGFWCFSFLYSFLRSERKFFRALVGCIWFNCGAVGYAALANGIFSFMVDDMTVLLLGSQNILRVLYLIFAKTVQFFALKLILVFIAPDDRLNRKSTAIMLFTTGVTITAVAILTNVIFIYQDKGIRFYVFLTIVMVLITNMTVYYLVYEVSNLMKSRYELKLLKERMNFEKERYEDTVRIWEKNRKLQHDIKNHFSVVLKYLKNNQTEDCEKYLGDLVASHQENDAFVCSDNPVLDYLINSKLSKLRDVKIIVTGSVDSFVDVEDVDLVSVMGNILDNAVEAVEKLKGEKRIELYFGTVNENRIIVCKNTIEGSVLKTNKKLISTKKDPEHHGYGHKIVAEILKKYSGWVNYFEDGDMFGVQIMIPKQQEK